MAQILDTGADITTAAMCPWEVLLQIRSNNPRDAIEKAMNAVYTRHGTCEMRNVMAEFAEDCVSEHNHDAVADRKSGVQGKGVSVRIGHSGSRLIKKNKT